MGDSSYPIGQNVPAGSYSSYPARATRAQINSQAASFQSILSQQQQPTNSAPTSTIAQSSAPISSALPPQFQKETLELMENMPHRMQPGENFQDKILQSQREYQSMKAAKSEPQPATQQPTAPQQIASGPTSAFNSAFGQSFSAAPIGSSPLPAETLYSQPMQGQLQPVIEPARNDNPLLNSNTTAPSRVMWSEDSASITTQASQAQTSATGNEKGVSESFFGFFKNVASFATLGFYRPNNEPAPSGLMRAAYPFKKLLWDAPKSLIVDTPTSIANSVTNSMNAKQPDQPQFAQATETSSRSSRRYASSKPWMHARA
ncbi:MAG: hypothetical protein P9L94_02070 [Candidatus Hinthialibacter antarcticus]|nr:hypothetical protein [Candidatus Hinthialibacter antarcticus]